MKMLSFSKEELLAMPKQDVFQYVLSLQAEKEIFEKLYPSVLIAMSKEDLVDRAVVLEAEIEWRKLQHMTSGGIE